MTLPPSVIKNKRTQVLVFLFTVNGNVEKDLAVSDSSIHFIKEWLFFTSLDQEIEVPQFWE